MKHYNTRPVQGRASSDLPGGGSLISYILPAYRAQILIDAYQVRPELAVLLAVIAFGGES